MAIITYPNTLQWVGDGQGNGKVALYDANGRAISYISTGEYLAPVQVRQTTAAAAGVVVWSMRGPPSLKAYIKKVVGSITFDGTATAATLLRYGLYHGVGAASATGGTALTAVEKNATFPVATVADLRQDTSGVGLTTTGIVYDANAMAVFSLPASPTGGVRPFELILDEGGELDSPFVIGANEHFSIRLETQAAIIGLSITGLVEWVER